LSACFSDDDDDPGSKEGLADNKERE